MTRKITGKLLAAAAMAIMASQGVASDGKTEPLKLRARRDDYDDAPADCQFVSVNRQGKRGGNGKGRKWWNS